MSAWNSPELLAKWKFWLIWCGIAVTAIGVITTAAGEIFGERLDTLLHPPLAVRFRTLLGDMNPDIIKAIDSGRHQFSVLVDASDIVRLTEMMREKDFEMVADVQVTSRFSMGYGNNVGQDFSDIHNTGQQTVCIFTLKHEDAP